ncbi:hypothetical protein DXG01_010008 [Tephrocybe rancida]|nr:hypothetical protein DXG01_010008 [Tephrocybe rancida]
MDDDVSKKRAMRPLDPLLLGSFPAPPTHIPLTPTSPINPPLTRPPSTPLPPVPGPSRRLLRHNHHEHDSISSINVRDILDAVTDDEDSVSDEMLSSLPPLARAKHNSRSFIFPPNSPRSASPDIPSILSATPRPRVHSLHKSKSKPSIRRRASDGPIALSSPYSGGGIYRPRTHSLSSPASDDDDTRSWIDHDEYGQPLPLRQKVKPTSDSWSSHTEDLHFAVLERQLEGSDSDGSDSSLDLHTPLPHLMMRHGLLSPRSKLVAPPPITGRDSVASLASTTSKSSHPLKDARDTAKRRVRHRDGRLLAGGIGLTTGLGWSDSEDEDAPSALTRRITSLNLSRSNSSLSLSRSTSSLSTAPSTPSLRSAPTRKPSTSSSLSSHTSSLPSHSRHPLSRSTTNTSTTTSLLRASDYSIEAVPSSDIWEPGLTPTAPGFSGISIPEGEESDMDMDTFSRYPTTGAKTHMHMLTASPEMSISEFGALNGADLKREKSLPPLPRSSVLSKSMGAPPRRTLGMRSGSETSSNGGIGIGAPRTLEVRSSSGSSIGTNGSMATGTNGGKPAPRTLGIRSSSGSSSTSTHTTGGRARTASTSTTASSASRGSQGSVSFLSPPSSGAVRSTTTRTAGSGIGYGTPPTPGNHSYSSTKSTPDPGTSQMPTPRPLRLASPPTSASPMPSYNPPSAPAPAPSIPPSTVLHLRSTTPTHLPAPLLLAQRLPRLPRDRPPVPVPTIPLPPTPTSTSRGPVSPVSQPATPTTPVSPTTPGTERKPRTGTGMVYRSSSGNLVGGGSRMRVPSSVRPLGMGVVGQKPIPL